MKRTLLTLPLVLPLLASNTCLAANAHSYLYAGAGTGTTTVYDDAIFHDIYLRTDDTSYKAYAGYQINRVIGVEAQYKKYGELYNRSTNNKFTVDPTSISLVANIGYTFDNGLRPFGSIGFGRTTFNYVSNKHGSEKDDYNSFHSGLGVEYSPSHVTPLTVRLAYEMDTFVIKDTIDDINVSVGSLHVGVSYRF